MNAAMRLIRWGAWMSALAQSRHGLMHCICLLLTQSGH